MEVDTICTSCKARFEFTYRPSSSIECSGCQAPLPLHATDAIAQKEKLDQCLMCGCEHLYRHRDFNRKLGVALVVVGIALAYFTYGVSILVLTALDFWLYKRVGEVISCYRCGSVYRNPPALEKAEPFNLSLADYYRSLEKR